MPPILPASPPPGPPPGPPPIPSPEFQDRSTALRVFGILQIVLGALCVLLAGLMLLGQMMASRIPEAQAAAMTPQTLIPAMLTYLALGGVFVGLGIGSIKCHRWARALSLVLAWTWLAVGAMTVPIMAFVLPRALASSAPAGQALPPGMVVTIVVVQLLFMTAFLLVLPAVLVFFYRSRHVKATCEARNPAPSWTDACPLPVLAVSCMLWIGGVMILSLPLAYQGFMPFFGWVLSGWAGTLVALGFSGLWIWAGLAWYRLKESGWWVLLGALLVFGLSNFLTFSRVDIGVVYEKMGYTQAQIDLIRQQGLLTNEIMMWSSVLWLVPMLGYLLWVKRFFRKREASLVS